MPKKNALLKFGVVIACLLLSQLLIAQHRADNWILWRAGINFQNDTAVPVHSVPKHDDRGVGVISDKNKELVIFTDGYHVFNRDGAIMVGGMNIFNLEYHSIAESLIVPLPNSDSLYYLFFVEPSQPIGENITGLYYAIVDLSLYNGKGAVTYVSDKILDNVTGRLTAVFHQNYNDIWIITQKKSVNHFYSFLVTESGISEFPVVSVGGVVLPHDYSGQLKASPDGTKVVNSYYFWDNGIPGQGFDTFEFNSQTGELTNPLIFKVPARGCEAAEFSSDATKLYIYQSGSTMESTLFQYDVSDYNFNKINDSRVSLLQPMYNDFPTMQLAPDGKIYLAKGAGSGPMHEYMGVINYPNRSGISCEVVEIGFYLDGGLTGSHTPNFIQSDLFKTDYQIHSFCFGDTTSFLITNLFRLDSVKWDFGDGTSSTLFNPLHVFPEPGNYSVTLTVYYPDKTDTIIKKIEIFPLPVVDLGTDTTVCHGYKLDLTAFPYDFVWNDGSSLWYLIPDTSGTYWVRAVNTYGCKYSDSVTLKILPAPYFSLGSDTAYCENTGINLFPDNTYDSSLYLWNNNSTDTLLYVDRPGSYSLEITNPDGCSYSDTVDVRINDAPIVDLGKDVELQLYNRLYLDAGDFGSGSSYLWDDNSTKQFRVIYNPGTDTLIYLYYVNVTGSNGCVNSDTINVKMLSTNSLGENAHGIRVYPNPCRLYLLIRSRSLSDKYVRFFNNLGQLVLEGEMKSGRKVFDVSGLKPSVYMVFIYSNDDLIFQVKVVVL